MDILARLIAGDRRAVARLISMVEDDGQEARQILADLYSYTGRAHIVGVTGAPGVGKSTLVNGLAKEYGEKGKRVGIVAVDASSPFSGGALLGDRIRMQEITGEPGVFIRSMATRGSFGGLARATGDAVKILDAAGYDVIFVETVGAGQSEVEIAKASHTTIVVRAPGLGDEIQALKAGILEIADIFAVNKADREGADRTALELEMMLDLNKQYWRPPVLKTIALQGEGIADVFKAIKDHALYLKKSGQFAVRERARVKGELERILRHELTERLFQKVGEDRFEVMLDRIVERELDPYLAAETLLRGMK